MASSIACSMPSSPRVDTCGPLSPGPRGCERIVAVGSFISRGFTGRRRERSDRLPPGQYDVGGGFPVLSAGPTPRTDLDAWDFTIQGEVDQVARWTWAEFQSLPRETPTVDITA